MRVVVKIGTSTLAYPTGHLHIRRTEELCRTVSDIKNANFILPYFSVSYLFLPTYADICRFFPKIIIPFFQKKVYKKRYNQLTCI